MIRSWKRSSRSGRRVTASQAYRPGLESVEPRLLLAHAPADVLTYHNNNGRTGQDLNETILNPGNVNPAHFGKLFTQPVDGAVYAQPLYKAGVSIPGKGTHNVVYVATEHDSVYAFDADSQRGASANPLWHVSFINPAAGITPIPSAEVKSDAFVSEIGITGTPVIDPSSATLYVISEAKSAIGGGASYVQELHALDLATGTEKFGGPVIIQAAVPGRGAGHDARGMVAFQPGYQLQRPGLLLLNGVVYAAWGSFGDTGPYHGWVLGYDARTLRQVAVLNTTPNNVDGAIWMSGGGIAADSAGNLYVATGNGTFSAASGGKDYGDSILKIATGNGRLRVADSFTPKDQSLLQTADLDLGSGGLLLVPDRPGAFPHELIGGGKDAKVFVVNRDSMGHSRAKPNNLVQMLSYPGHKIFASPAYFNNTVFLNPVGDALKAYTLTNGQLTLASMSSRPLGYPGATPSISASGSSNGIVWEVQTDTWQNPNGQAVLHAYDARDVSHELYNSAQAGARDRAGAAVKFVVPTIAHGKVYVGTQTGLTVFGSR